MKLKPIIAITILAAMSVVTAACGGPKLNVEPIAATENPFEQANRLDNEIGAARNNQVNVLAPASFAKAEEYLAAARKGLENKDEPKKILENVSYGTAQLKLAQDLAARSKSVLAETVKARDFARAAGATSFEREYGEAEEQFLDLTKAVEKNDTAWAQKKQGAVAETFRELELRAIKTRTLGEVRDLIAQAERKQAREIAPKSLATAKKALVDADDFITRSPYEKEKILALADAALFQSHRLLEVMEQSEKLKSMKPEDISLWVEGILEKITQSLAAPDMRDQAFDTQEKNILGSIATLQKDKQFMIEQAKTRQAENTALKKECQTEVAARDKHIAALEGKTKEEQEEKERLTEKQRVAEERLAAEKQYNQRFEEIRTYFDANEAEIYKQGNQLVIRLKAMQFPVGKDIIMPDTYPLLSKVQRAIRTFGEPSVVVEGHTDSTGSVVTNEHLSQKRAEAVRAYLVANATLPGEKISAVGYGSKRPLASNETAEGRAINRRIDVIITPAALALQ